MSTGGSIESVTLDGRTFAVSADTDAQIKPGGFENETQANGDGTTRTVKTRVPWAISDLNLDMDDFNGDLEFLQALANRNTEFPITIALASGAIRQGTGQINGEVQQSTTNATASVSLMGSGELTLQ
jgi:hypothetical protein